MEKSVNYLYSDSAALEELRGLGSHVFSNDHFGMVLNANAVSSDFIREGQVYHVMEPRIIMLLEGSVDISIDLEDYHLEKGAVAMSRQDVIIEMKNCPPDASVVGIVFREEMDIHETTVVHTTPSAFSRLLRLAYLIWDEASLSPFPVQTVRHLLQSLTAEILYLHDTATDAAIVRQSSSRYQVLFRQFKRFASLHCERERNIPFYADLLHITPHHLSAVIKEVSGQSVMWWVNRAVIQRAKVMLKTSNMTAAEVADRLNYQSAAAFSNFFKRETGMTPLAYRQKN